MRPWPGCASGSSKRGLRLMLDFVPNHTGLDHPWVEDHPEYYIQGTELDLARAPQNYTWVKRKQGDLLLAHGRDPYFPGWPDTLQLNYGNPATQEAMIGELLKIAGQCDGVRCDMAMLVLPDVFERTWGTACAALLAEGDPARAASGLPASCFMAEVYWDLEWTLQQQGFDYAYDKRLYDRLREGHARPVREHFHAGLDYQDKLGLLPARRYVLLGWAARSAGSSMRCSAANCGPQRPARSSSTGASGWSRSPWPPPMTGGSASGIVSSRAWPAWTPG